MRIAVVGAGGRLGSTLSRDFESHGHDVIRLGRAELDITDVDRVKTVISHVAPEVIVNCSAYNAVDAAESDRAGAFAVNADGPAALAAAAGRIGALLVHYSTDFVFDGEASEPYPEDAATNPLSVYGASKLDGEHAAALAERHYVLRVESLFGGAESSRQKATVDYIADTLAAGLPVRAIVDRTVTPSSVQDVVHATRRLIQQEAPCGTYHCVSSGPTNWYELAQEIARYLGGNGHIIPVESRDFITVAARPRYCALSNAKLKAAGIDMPTWRASLARHLRSRCTIPAAPPALRVQLA
jgi:dTDP-4-dehydrorhamnose reductase